MGKASDKLLRELRAYGLGLPGATSASPWPGHDDLRVGGKTFAFLSVEGEPFSLSVKLAYTAAAALERSDASPTHYGLGKWGWVTFRPSDEAIPSMDQLKEWVEESYRSQAPRRLVKELDERAAQGA